MKIEVIDLPEDVMFEIQGNEFVYEPLTLQAKLPEPDRLFIGDIKFVSDVCGKPVPFETQYNPMVFEIVVNPYCHIDSVRKNRFELIDRVQLEAKKQLAIGLNEIVSKYEDLGCRTVYQVYLYGKKLEILPSDDLDKGVIGWIIFSNLAMFGI